MNRTDRERSVSCPSPPSPPPTNCWPTTSCSFHASGNLKRPTGESYAPFRHLRSRSSLYLPSPLRNPLRHHPHPLHPSYYPGGDSQEQIYHQRSAPVRRTTRTMSQRRRLSETTTPSAMLMEASGHRTGCSEQNQRGVSKSSYFLVHVLPLEPRPLECAYNCVPNLFGRDPDRAA